MHQVGCCCGLCCSGCTEVRHLPCRMSGKLVENLGPTEHVNSCVTAPPLCSATVLKATLPAALLAFALHGSVWGGAPPGPVAAAEAAAYAGAAVAAGSELWKILEGFQG